MILYKLTDQDFTTHGCCLWGEGFTHTADGLGELCTKHWLHAYEHPSLAVFMNPAHGGFCNPILWECDGIVGATDYGLKVGCTVLTSLRQIPLPVVTIEQCVRFAIVCAVSVYQEPSFISWATNWLDKTDRSKEAAAAARRRTCKQVAARLAPYSIEVLAEAQARAPSYVSLYPAVAAIWSVQAIAAAEAAEQARAPSYVSLYAAVAAIWSVQAIAAAEAAEQSAKVVSLTNEMTLDLVTCAEWAMSDSVAIPIIIKGE